MVAENPEVKREVKDRIPGGEERIREFLGRGVLPPDFESTAEAMLQVEAKAAEIAALRKDSDLDVG